MIQALALAVCAYIFLRCISVIATASAMWCGSFARVCVCIVASMVAAFDVCMFFLILFGSVRVPAIQ